MPKSKSKRIKRRRMRPHHVDHVVTDGRRVATKTQQASACYHAGDLEKAKQLACEILEQDETNADAWHVLGMTMHAAKSYVEAFECLEKARALVGDHPELLSNMAIVFQAMGETELAQQTLAHVVLMDPSNAHSRNNYGVVLLENGALEQAEEQFEQAVWIDASIESAAMNLANCWMRQNRLHDAEHLYRTLLRHEEDNLDVLSNLGECLRRQCKWEESLDILDRVVQTRPEDLVTRLTQARALVNDGQLPKAMMRLSELVAEMPHCAKAHHYLGTVLHKLGDLWQAEASIQCAIRLNPKDAYAHCSLGFVHIDSDQRPEAVRSFARAIEIDPSLSLAHGCLLYLLSGDSDVSPERLFEEHVRWGQTYGNVKPIGPHRNLPDPTRRLRIGYASGDFREHAVSVFFEPLLRLCDHANFETFCYHESGVDDNVTEKLKSMSDHWRVTQGYSDAQVAKMILDDEIDIMVDLAGHTAGNRLTALAMKPAPVQISWLGYPNTTGLKAIDYCVTCDVQNPIGEPTLHTEDLIRIPGGSFSFAPPKNAPEVSTLPAMKNGYVTLGSLHRPFKISSATHDLWAETMRAIPNAKLLAFNTRFNDRLEMELVNALVDRGIDPGRIEVRNSYDGDSYLETYKEIDIGLDVTPWAGGTTTMEALWMGIPVIGFYGKNRPARGTAGIVHHLGKPEWIAKSTEQYSQLVAELAGDFVKLSALRRSLREITSQTIADEQRFVTELQRAYRAAWVLWCDEQSCSMVPTSAMDRPAGSDPATGSATK